MRGFLIIFCFAFAHADKLGYSYASGGSHHGFGNRFKHRATPVTTAAPATNGLANGVNGGLGGFVADTIPTEQQYQQPIGDLPEYNKEFFSYEAPEEDFNDFDAAQRMIAAMRKNLRVVFIKAPENNALANAALQLAKQSAESKTAIYVLSKKPDYSDLANKFQAVQQQGHADKPEVHFVKYRTPDDAIRAQQIIQREYDTLGGPSRISNEGVAPVLDFSSPSGFVARKNVESLGDDHINGNSDISSSPSVYLPPKQRA